MTLLELTPVLAFEQEEDHVAIHTGGRTHILSFNDAMIVKGMIEEAYSEMMEDTEASLRAELNQIVEILYNEDHVMDVITTTSLEERMDWLDKKLAVMVKLSKKPH